MSGTGGRRAEMPQRPRVVLPDWRKMMSDQPLFGRIRIFELLGLHFRWKILLGERGSLEPDYVLESWTCYPNVGAAHLAAQEMACRLGVTLEPDPGLDNAIGEPV